MTTPTTAMRALLEGLVDYAGLFPPAQLDMGAAVAQYADHLRGDERWMLGRFIVASPRLDEFEGAAAALLPRDTAAKPWHLSVLAGQDGAEDAERVWAFNERHAHAAAGRAVVDAMEIRAATAEAIGRGVRSVPRGIRIFVEVPIAQDPIDLIHAIAGTGAGAKVRTGGVTPHAFPSPAELARFIRICTDSNVPFKATAGLHHPLRGEYRLTYETDSPSGTMYGFLNVFLAGVFAGKGLGLDELERLLQESNPAAFSFDDGGIGWHGHRVDLADIRHARVRGGTAFGSCSFTEPVADLRAIHLL